MDKCADSILLRSILFHFSVKVTGGLKKLAHLRDSQTLDPNDLKIDLVERRKGGKQGYTGQAGHVGHSSQHSHPPVHLM